MSKTSYRILADGGVIHEDEFDEYFDPFQAEDFEQYLIDDSISVMEYENPDDPKDSGWCWTCNICGASSDYIGHAEGHECPPGTAEEVEKWRRHYNTPVFTDVQLERFKKERDGLVRMAKLTPEDEVYLTELNELINDEEALRRAL